MTAHIDAPTFKRLTHDELREITAVNNAIERAWCAVRELGEDHPALAHLQAATDAVTDVAFGYVVSA